MCSLQGHPLDLPNAPGAPQDPPPSPTYARLDARASICCRGVRLTSCAPIPLASGRASASPENVITNNKSTHRRAIRDDRGRSPPTAAGRPGYRWLSAARVLRPFWRWRTHWRMSRHVLKASSVEARAAHPVSPTYGWTPVPLPLLYGRVSSRLHEPETRHAATAPIVEPTPPGGTRPPSTVSAPATVAMLMSRATDVADAGSLRVHVPACPRLVDAVAG
jgi:hypothetical protein